MDFESFDKAMAHINSSRNVRTTTADSGREMGMEEWIYYIRTRNPPAQQVT